MMIAALICSNITFSGCSKDDDDLKTSVVTSIDGQVTGGTANIARVWLVSEYGRIGNPLEGAYTHSTTTLKFDLPETVPASHLSSVEYFVDEGFKVSNKSANISFVEIEGRTSTGSYLGDFFYVNQRREIVAMLVYADADVNITGSYSEREDGYTWRENCRVSLKKGWNWVYHSEEESGRTYTFTLSTENPGNMTWVFMNDYPF